MRYINIENLQNKERSCFYWWENIESVVKLVEDG